MDSAGAHRSDEAAEGMELQRRLALIAAVSARLGGGGRFRDNVAFLAAEVANVLRADACVLRELRGDRLALLARFGVPEGILQEHIPVQGIAETMLRDRAPISVLHANEDPITAPIARNAPKDPRHFKFLSYAGAPMFADGRIVGLLGIYMTRTPRAFEKGDLDLLQIVANAVGIALANDRLFSRFAGADPALRLRISGMLGEVGTATPAWESDEHALRLAYDMARSRPDLEIHYQPLRAPGDRRVRGHEALARWRHPTQGLLGPDQFIALAEQTGHIGDIGIHAADRAMRDLARLCRPGESSFVGINVSIVQLADPTFPDRLAALAESNGLRPANVVLEITERIVLRRDSEAGRSIHRLAERGFPVYIDDFGAGYSSLSHLIDFPVAGVKIDRSFLPQTAGDERRRQLLACVARMAHDMGLVVVAEGVEQQFQEDFAAEVGINLVQGYLIGLPAPLP